MHVLTPSDRRYFRIVDEYESADRWFLGAPRDLDGKPVDPECFGRSQSVPICGGLNLAIRRDGEPLDFSFADFDMPVASLWAARILTQIASSDIELCPARVDNHSGDFAVINALTCLPCLDEERSRFIKWTEADERPDKVGQYRQVTRLVINTRSVSNSEIFRVEGWLIALIVSERIKEALEKEGVRGPVFLPVT